MKLNKNNNTRVPIEKICTKQNLTRVILLVLVSVALLCAILFKSSPNDDYLLSKKSAAFQYQITPKRCEGKHKLLIYSKLKEVQSIELPTDYGKSDCHANLMIIEDVNFDSYEDVAVYKASGGMGPNFYTYFTYDPGAKKFVFDDQLNKFNLRGAEFSSFNKTITDLPKTSSWCGYTRRSFNMDGHKIYQSYERAETCSDRYKKATITTKLIDKDGKVTETDEETRGIR